MIKRKVYEPETKRDIKNKHKKQKYDKCLTACDKTTFVTKLSKTLTTYGGTPLRNMSNIVTCYGVAGNATKH